MAHLQGTGVYERSEDWTIRSVFEDWISDGELSRRKKAFLETTHTQMMNVLEKEACMEPKVTPSWMRDELDSPSLIFEYQCVADLLDHLSPKKGQMKREQEIHIALDNLCFF